MDDRLAHICDCEHLSLSKEVGRMGEGRGEERGKERRGTERRRLNA